VRHWRGKAAVPYHIHVHLGAIARRFAIGLALLGTSACIEFELFGPDTCFMDGCGGAGFGSGPPEPYFRILPGSTRILLGDTVTLAACFEFEGCDPSGNVTSAWTLTHDAAAILTSNGALTNSEPAARKVVIRGQRPGSADITATDTANPARHLVARVEVADSSAIRSIDMRATSDTLRVSNYGNLYVFLRDSVNQDYRGVPTEWSVSDTTVLELRGFTPPSIHHATARVVYATRPGVVTIHVKFLDVAGSLKLVVVP
jgi:hypothetical protein